MHRGIYGENKEREHGGSINEGGGLARKEDNGDIKQNDRTGVFASKCAITVFLIQSYMFYMGALRLSTEASAGVECQLHFGRRRVKCFHLCGDAAQQSCWCPSHIILGVVCCCIYSGDAPSVEMAVYLVTLW